MGEQPSPVEPPIPDVIVARPIMAVSYACAPPRSPLELPTLSRRTAAGGLVLVLIAFFATICLSLTLGILVGSVISRPSPGLLNALLIGDKWISALVALACCGFLLNRHRLIPASFGLRLRDLGQQVAWGAATLLGVYGAFIVSLVPILILVLTVPSVQKDLLAREEFLQMMPLNNPAIAVLLLIPVAVHEELLFRGLLLPYLHRVGCSWSVAILISATIFASLHITQGWLAIPQVFCVAVALSTFFVLSRSLLAVMLAHFLFDFVQLQIIHFIAPWLEQASKQL